MDFISQMEINALEADIACYATAVYHEVNNRSLEEKLGVINVIRNRVKSGRWGFDVCSVVYASGQFIGVTDESHKKVTAAEIGGAAIGAGLGIGMARAEELGAFGVTKAEAQQKYQTIADILPSATKLSSIYAKQGLGAYDQAVAEQEVFGISGAATAAQKRRKLSELETAQFSGQTGVGALARERAGTF